MPLHTKKQFADLCGIKTGDLSNYQKRSKVVYSGEYVDDSIEPNISFLKKALDKKNGHQVPESAKEETLPVTKELTTLNISEPKFRTPKAPKIKEETDKAHNSKYQHEVKKVILANEKLLEEIEYWKNRNSKISGDTIPTALVKNAFAFQFKTYTTGFLNAMEKALARWGKAKDFTREEMAEARGAIKKDINEAVDTASAESKKAIKNIIAISSIKKEVGERE